MSVDDIRRKAGKFQTKILWRNAREYVAALAVVVYFGFVFFRTRDALTRAALCLIIGGVLYVAWHLYRQGSSRRPPEDIGLASGIEFMKRELERQRDLLASVWRWYLGPLIPGWVVLMVALARTNPGHVRRFALSMTLFNVVTAILFIGVGKLNRRGARKLQRQIDELDAQKEAR